MNAELFMVFDVESIGLHGEGYAVGWVVVDRNGTRLARGRFACDPSRASGSDEGRKWVAENCPPMVVNCREPDDVRWLFWEEWLIWKAKGAVLCADVAWPVEARFLARCVDDAPDERAADGPYPLLDVSSVRFAAGLDPLATEPRLEREDRPHHPMNDAMQSARLLIEALDRIENRSGPDSTAPAHFDPEQPAVDPDDWDAVKLPATVPDEWDTFSECIHPECDHMGYSNCSRCPKAEHDGNG